MQNKSKNTHRGSGGQGNFSSRPFPSRPCTPRSRRSRIPRTWPCKCRRAPTPVRWRGGSVRSRSGLVSRNEMERRSFLRRKHRAIECFGVVRGANVRARMDSRENMIDEQHSAARLAEDLCHDALVVLVRGPDEGIVLDVQLGPQVLVRAHDVVTMRWKQRGRKRTKSNCFGRASPSQFNLSPQLPIQQRLHTINQ